MCLRDAAITVAGIFSLPRHRPSMAPTPSCRFSVRDNVDHPISLYAASKKANELMAHAYSHLYRIPATGLRFFTVYGPWGRPDMAMFIFAKAILEGKPIRLFNYGNMRRDFTYVDDVVEAIARLIDRPPQGNPAWSGAQSRSCLQRCAVEDLQHRQQSSRRIDARGRAAGEGVRPPGDQGNAADAAWRRTGHLRRHRRSRARRRLQARHVDRRWHRAIFKMVPRVSWDLTRPGPAHERNGKASADRRRELFCQSALVHDHLAVVRQVARCRQFDGSAELGHGAQCRRDSALKRLVR